MKPQYVKNLEGNVQQKRKLSRRWFQRKKLQHLNQIKVKVLTTKEVKILLSKTDDTRNKTEMENKDKIKLALQIEDGEEGIEKTDQPKFKHVQNAR